MVWQHPQGGWRETERIEHVAPPTSGEIIEQLSDADLERMITLVGQRIEEETARAGLAAVTAPPRLARRIP